MGTATQRRLRPRGGAGRYVRESRAGWLLPTGDDRAAAFGAHSTGVASQIVAAGCATVRRPPTGALSESKQEKTNRGGWINHEGRKGASGRDVKPVSNPVLRLRNGVSGTFGRTRDRDRSGVKQNTWFGQFGAIGDPARVAEEGLHLRCAYAKLVPSQPPYPRHRLSESSHAQYPDRASDLQKHKPPVQYHACLVKCS